MADFSDFCQFVSEQADLAADPIYSDEMVGRPKDADENFRTSGNRRFKREKGSTFGTNVSKPDGGLRIPRSRTCTTWSG